MMLSFDPNYRLPNSQNVLAQRLFGQPTMQPPQNMLRFGGQPIIQPLNKFKFGKPLPGQMPVMQPRPVINGPVQAQPQQPVNAAPARAQGGNFWDLLAQAGRKF